MNRTSSSGPPATDAPIPGPEGSKRHFDTFETQFFKQGDESAADSAADVERFDNLDEGRKRKRFAPSRHFIIAVGVGSACLAVIGCVVLWRSGSHPNSSVAASQKSAAVSPAPSDPTPPPAAAVVAAAPSGPFAAAPPAVALGATPTAAAPSPPPAPIGPAPTAALPATEPAQPTPAAVEAASEPAKPTASVAAAAAIARARCKDAVGNRRQKDLLSACSDAFAADPGAADIAVILAKTEFDRGRPAQALAWSQKALAADPNAAEAYVFIGGVEQGAGHNKAAKDAYRRYLQLAPTGRYAGDLRAIVGSL